MTGRILTVFGDKSFPKHGRGVSSKKRIRATAKISRFLKDIAPDLVYVIPKERTEIMVAAVCREMKIPFIVIVPYPGFADGNVQEERHMIHKLVHSSKTCISVNSTAPENKKEKLEIWEEAVKYGVQVSDAVAFVHAEGNSKFEEFKEETSSYEPDHYWVEVIYDT